MTIFIVGEKTLFDNNQIETIKSYGKVIFVEKDSYINEIINNNEEKLVIYDPDFGGLNFMGEEVVYEQDNTPILGMNYYGITLDKSLSEEAMDKALRPALMQVGSDERFQLEARNNI